MALEKCKECGHQISQKATTCPSCGAPIKRTSTTTKIIAGFIVFSIFTSIFMSCMASNDQAEKAAAEAQRVASLTPEQRAVEAKAKAIADQKAQENQNLITAIHACQSLITKQMKDPSSVEFLLTTDQTPVGKTKKGNYAVQTKVRAKNSFGAFTISSFDCVVAQDGNNWKLLKLKEY